jgi:drug/metabolite transporter (DMT)-like permease
MNWIVPLSFLILFELIADIFAKEYSLNNTYTFWFGAIVSYVIANAFWLNAIKNGSGLGKGAIIFSVVSAVMATIIGIVLYKEVVTKIQLIGIFLGIVSLVFIFWE